MDIKEIAVTLHSTGRNCAQCVFMACSPYSGVDEAVAESSAAAFGGGMRCGEVCGAITGGLMAIGASQYENTGSRVRINELTAAYIGAFRNQYGCILCRELKSKGISCDELIGFGAQAAENLIR